MVDTTLILGIFVFLLAAVVIFKFIKGLAKALLALGAVVALLLALAIALAAMDAKNFAENVRDEPVLVLMVEDQQAVAGVEIKKGEVTNLEQHELDRHSLFLDKRDYPVLRKDYFKAVLVDKDLVLALADNEEKEKLAGASLDESTDAFSSVAFDKAFAKPITVVKGMRSGQIIVTPESAAVKVVKLIPTGAADTAKNAFDKTIGGVLQ